MGDFFFFAIFIIFFSGFFSFVARKMGPSLVKATDDVGSSAKRLLMARPGNGSEGQIRQTIQLLTNHFRVSLKSMNNAYFYHYDVALSFVDTRSDGTSVERVAYKGFRRKVMDRVLETELLKGKNYVYDGRRSLFTGCLLPFKEKEYQVVLDDISSRKFNPLDILDICAPYGYGATSKTFKVKIRYAATIPMQAIADGLRGRESNHFQGAVGVLDIILRQHEARQGGLVNQSFSHDNPWNFTDLKGCSLGYRGFHSGFRATRDGLSLNVDVTTTLIVRPGPVVDFLLMNQNVRRPNMIDWTKAKAMLTNLRIKVNNTEHTITGLTDSTCRNQKFSLSQGRNEDGEVQSVEITVFEYYARHKHINLLYSADMPCINVGKPKHPCYFPIELCNLVSLQRYTEALTTLQRAALVEKSRQKPQELKAALTDLLRNSGYENGPMLQSFRITIDSQLAPIEGRVLPAPRIRVGNCEEFVPQNGRWNFNNKQLYKPVEIKNWAIVDFSARCDIEGLINGLRRCGERKGLIFLERPYHVFQEEDRLRHKPAPFRVDKMSEKIFESKPKAAKFLLCILAERKNSEIYGPWKRKCLAIQGVATQCIAPTKVKVNDQYLTNVLLKINAKLGGMNFSLSMRHSQSLPLYLEVPTLILGMHVSHGSPSRSDTPSIAAVVNSRNWPSISHYKATVCTQPAKVEMIADLFKPSDTEDNGIIRELLLDFYHTSERKKPKHIIIFRDGVSESQFNQVLNTELKQIIKACKHFEESWEPKFTLIVAQKKHHTWFFQANSQDNVPPGTVVDKTICHPKYNDFYMCAHAGKIGTTRPTHYHILYDEIGFSTDALQELVHSLSYAYQRSTTAISVVAPICYARLAADQMRQFIKFDEVSETSSGHAGLTSAGADEVPKLLKLHETVNNTMFFC